MIISVEKCFALYFPFKSKIICTVRIAKKVSLVSAVIYFAFFSQLFYFAKQKSSPLGSLYCDLTFPSYWYEKIFYNIYSTLYTYIPLAIMVSANFAIIYKFMKAKLKTGQSGTQSTEQALSKSATRGTAMLLTVSFAFIILTGPISLGQIFYMPDLIFAVLLIFQYANHGINGFLYCASGRRFRNELKNTLCSVSTN